MQIQLLGSGVILGLAWYSCDIVERHDYWLLVVSPEVHAPSLGSTIVAWID